MRTYWNTIETSWVLAIYYQPMCYSADDTSQPTSTLVGGNGTQIDTLYDACDLVIQGQETLIPFATEIEKDKMQIYTQKRYTG